jgi:hypothetical protein
MDGRRARVVLGVDNDAGPDEIRRAFRRCALVTHPDHGGDRAAFAELTDALVALGALAPAPETRRPSTPVRVPVALSAARTRFDVYDSPRRPAPRRAFADVLQAAVARAGAE